MTFMSQLGLAMNPLPQILRGNIVILFVLIFWVFGEYSIFFSLDYTNFVYRDTVPNKGLLRSQTPPFVNANPSICVFRQALALDEVSEVFKYVIRLLTPFNFFDSVVLDFVPTCFIAQQCHLRQRKSPKLM
jgi:hypothetical protein